MYKLIPILFAILWPVKSHDLIPQTFGIASFGGYHTGIDILVPVNTPVFAVCKGTVVLNNTDFPFTTAFAAYWNSFVIIEHDCNGNKVFGYYGHISANVGVSAKVKSGQVIGYVVLAKSITDKVTPVGVDRPSNTHLHFSMNKKLLTSRWGYEFTEQSLIKAGWLDPMLYLNMSN